jgi:fructose-bisphosphate aldolase class II
LKQKNNVGIGWGVEQEGAVQVPLANFKELLADAQKSHYAVPCLVVLNIEMAIGLIIAAEKKRSPVILAFPPNVTQFVSSGLFIPFLISAAEKSSAPVAIQLDHGLEYKEIMNAIKCGASAVMFDGSDLEYDSNVERTKEIVKVAHAFNIAVEAELGFVGGSVLKATGEVSQMTEPDKVADFISKTKVDALAVSIGNLHGKYISEPNLDIDRLRAISSTTNMPLVLHGGSGLSVNDYKNVMKNGISDVHFYSYLASDVWPELKNRSESLGRGPIYHEIMEWTIEYYIKAGGNVMDILESSQKASIFCDRSLYSDMLIEVRPDNKQNVAEVDVKKITKLIK